MSRPNTEDSSVIVSYVCLYILTTTYTAREMPIVTLGRAIIVEET